jgi:hypothetical protein
MACALLVTHQDVADLLLLEKLVIDRQDRAARLAENRVDAMLVQCMDYHFGACHLHFLAHRPDNP